MGEMAEESLYDYRDDFKKIKDKFKVELVERKTMKVLWQGKFNAKDEKQCQETFRNNYQHIRDIFKITNANKHLFALRCTRK